MDLRKSKTTAENEKRNGGLGSRNQSDLRCSLYLRQAMNGMNVNWWRWTEQTSNDERDCGRAHMSIWPYLILNEIMSTFCHRKCYLLQNKCNRGSILLAPNRIGSIVAHYKWRCKNFASNVTAAVIRQRKMRSQCIKCNEYLEVKWNELNLRTEDEDEDERWGWTELSRVFVCEPYGCCVTVSMRYCTAGCCYWWVYLQRSILFIF